MARPLLRPLSLAAAAGLAILFGETLTAGRGMAEVYRNARTTLDTVLAQIVGMPERRPRDLMVNGKPLQFTPYQSDRSVAEITDEWLDVLGKDVRPAVAADGDLAAQVYAEAANQMILPKVSRVGDGFAVVVRFFDGDGPAALRYLRAENAARAKGAASGRPMPGVAVSIRRPPGSGATEVLMSRFEDVRTTLAAFAAPADLRKLPVSLRPPAGAEVLSDIGDRGAAHTSRTVISRGTLSARNWSDTRSRLLERAGFSVETSPPGRHGVLALHARRETVEADVLYTRGDNPGEIVEVIEIRQPLAEGNGS